eukprot:GGOE01010885.1.p1 GENE.GGOE01010885.1~~GGOE01010885.1.p1  ORF type:complete len:788 (-),score=227.33 GGOE01010885.1:544-2877(-)
MADSSCGYGLASVVPVSVAAGPSTMSIGATWPRDFVNVCTIPEGSVVEAVSSTSQSTSNRLRRASVCKLLPSKKPPPAPLPQRPCRCPLSWTLALVPGVLICFVGFLAWGVPFSNLSATISPLATAIRVDIISSISTTVKQSWAQMRTQCLVERAHWGRNGPPLDPFASAELIGKRLYPLVLYDLIIVAAPVVVASNSCVLISNLQQHVELGWVMDRQNCTNRWIERWDNNSLQLTGEVVQVESLVTRDMAMVGWPVSAATPAQPFTWLSHVYNPLMGHGDVLIANVALFQPGTNEVVGRAGVTMSTRELQQLLQEELEQQAATNGGRLALFEKGGLVVAASHGVVESVHRLLLTDIGDPDLEAAGQLVRARAGAWCPTASVEVDFSIGYFLDTRLVVDSDVSVQQLEWCILLLAPRGDIMAPVNRALWFAVAVVCGTTCGVTVLSFVLGLVVTRPILRLTKGMRALQLGDFSAARQATGRKSFFGELLVAQEAYDALVGVVDAFGRYVPQMVVRGLLEGTVRAELGMKEKTVAIAFMDVENFTAMCESITPDEIVQITSSLFDRCCQLIFSSDGTVDKFLGDCIMALWGAPAPLALPGRNALEAVHEILQFLCLEPLVLRNGTRVGIRIGLNGGFCLVGNFGATARWDYTAIGDAVNIAARLEPLNKQFGTHCLVSDTIYNQVEGVEALEQCMRPMGNVLLIGKQNLVRVYELQAAPMMDVEGWSTAIQQYTEGQLDVAADYFASIPGDSAAKVLAREIRFTPAADAPLFRMMRSK